MKGEMLDPLGIEYFRRLSLTERANQTSGGPDRDATIRSRRSLEPGFPVPPGDARCWSRRSTGCPNEHGRHIIRGYAEHVAHVLGTGRKAADGTPVPVRTSRSTWPSTRC